MLLAEESLSVAELQELLGMGQSRISTQLSQLKNGGLVRDERSGKNNIYFCAAEENLMKVARLATDELTEVAADRIALEHIRRKRKDSARVYFDQLAGKFGKDYVPGRSWKALAEALLKVMPSGTVADLGAGEGTLSQLLSQRAEKVIAVDISPKMCAFGQQLAKEHGIDHLEYRLGDLENPPIAEQTLDLAVLSQALHHAEHPAKAIRAAFSILKPGGRLIVLDLLQHAFEQARELYADRWLGFSESELSIMLHQAGFAQIETMVVDQETEAPRFQTLLGIAMRPLS